jgi:hypothetical protein
MKNKGFAPLLLLIIGLVLCIGGYFAYRFSTKFTGAPLEELSLDLYASPTPDQTVHWKTYVNNTYHYTVKYPPEWHATEYNDDRSGISIENNSEYISFAVGSMPMYIADAPKAEIKLNGYQASQWAKAFYDVPLINNKHLHITRTASGSVKTIDQILSTFKFTGSNSN